ncbi:MAG: S26 family signal peptidase [Chloroflexi bacterium]|nr:S26 family signal peptidase [Chloroflexota bacterium]
MEPVLRDGDWLVVAALRRPPRAGELVVLDDPLAPGRLLVKRVRDVTTSGVRVGSDASEHAGHLAERGVIPLSLVHGRPVLRYAPLARVGIPR